MLMLHYKKHGEHILDEISAAFRGEHPADLLLVCEGRQTLKAHKLVLAAASPLIRMLLEETPTFEGVTTVHFPDVEVTHFKSLLDFLYSGQICVPANAVEHLRDLLYLLQIKPGDPVWRTGDKGSFSPGERVEVVSRLEEDTIKEPQIDINSNEDERTRRRRSKSRDSTISQVLVKREKLTESSCDDDREDGEVDDDDSSENNRSISLSKRKDSESSQRRIRAELNDYDEDMKIPDDDNDLSCDDNSDTIQKRELIGERRRSSSDPVNLSIGNRDRQHDDDSNEGHIDVETIGNAPSKSLIPARLLDSSRTKRKVLYHPADTEILKPPEHEFIHNSPDNYVVTPHRKRRPGFNNSPAQNPPFVPVNHNYLEDLRSRKAPSASAPPYFQGDRSAISPSHPTDLLLHNNHHNNNRRRPPSADGPLQIPFVYPWNPHTLTSLQGGPGGVLGGQPGSLHSTNENTLDHQSSQTRGSSSATSGSTPILMWKLCVQLIR